MIKEKGITLISLVVTIIILIILAGVSINLTLGEEGIITIAKKAKENIEFAQIEEQKKLNELYLQFECNVEEEFDYDIISKLDDFKKRIAEYIEEAGGIKPDDTAEVEIFGERIKGIVKEVTKDATATADNLTEGKTAWVNGEKIIGTGVDNKSSYNEGMDSVKDILYNGNRTYKTHNWNSSTGLSGQLTSQAGNTNGAFKYMSFSGRSPNINLLSEDGLLMTFTINCSYSNAYNSNWSGNNTVTLYDANGKRIDSKTGSGEYKFALAEYDVSTNYVYFEFSGTIGCPIGNALGTPSVVSYRMR